jgi:hypothetical protein
MHTLNHAAAELRYNIASGLLEGVVDGVRIHGQAGSGGRAGSKSEGALNWWLANNPFATRVKLSADHSNIGGPLPMGSYRLNLHESRSNWIRLTPLADTLMHGRDGFAIHGRGKRGSDGCIVPTDFNLVLKLCQLVGRRERAKRPAVVVDVYAEGQHLDRQLRTA